MQVRRRADGVGLEVWDPLRRKYVALTPEEQVRQQFTAWLITTRHYPAALMANEVTVDVGGHRRRCDTLIYDRSGAPWMIVEYKEPEVRLTQAVFDQIARYNMALHAPYLTVSNGHSHYCLRVDFDQKSYTFLSEIPDYCE